MSDERTMEGTAAQFEAWLAASESEHGLEPAAAAAALADLFLRAQRGGADLHDPTDELILWLSRDLARDPHAEPGSYDSAIGVLPHYMLFMRAHQQWRRSEHAVRACWDAIDIVADAPLGLTTLGDSVDAAIAEGFDRRPDPADLLAVGLERGYVAPLQATLDTLVAHESLSLTQVAGLIGVPNDSVAFTLWMQALVAIDLVRVDDDRVTPRPAVTAAGGCPPPSADLISLLVRALTRAAVSTVVAADAADELYNLPRTTPTLVALMGARDKTWFLPEDENDTEEGTFAIVEHMLSSQEQGEAMVAEVREVLLALVRFGVLEEVTLPQGSIALLAPESFHHAVVRAITDVTGVVGTPDETAPWVPVELPFSMAPDVGVDLLISLEHDPQVWRRFRILGSTSLEFLHLIVQSALSWRDTRSNAFSTADGTVRFAPRWLLGRLRGEEYAEVVDADAVRIGSILKAPGDELTYLYGSLTNPWRVRIRVERAMSGMKESIAWLDGGGQAPEEPTVIGEQIAERLPEGMSVPAELERAWVFMESKRWSMITDDGVALVAPGPPEARPGVVFSSGLSLAGALGENSPALERTFPIAISPDETFIALWLDDHGTTQVIAVRGDGGGSLIGSPVDLLRLAGVGYEEISTRVLGQPPQNPDAVAGVAEYREWVQGTLGAPVPELWGPLHDDHVAAWLAAQRDTAG